MTRSQRLLIIAGLALTLWGMADGLLYAVFFEHQALDHLGGALATAFAQAARGDMSASRFALDDYAASNYFYVREVDAHSHWAGLAMVLILLGLIFDRVAFSERWRYALALAMSAGAAIFPLGVLLQAPDSGPLPKALAIAGTGLLVFGFSACVVGFLRRRVP
jgi:hypothetical protein